MRTKILLGLTYYVVDRAPEAVRTLLEAVKLDPNAEGASKYLGEITLEQAASPDPVALAEVCRFADANPKQGGAHAVCGGVLLRAARESGDKSRQAEILRRLEQAVRLAPGDAIARCQLGKALEWTEQWREARAEMEECVRLQPDSPEGHYRLARIYRRLGERELAQRESRLQEEAANRQSEESVRRANAVEKFLFILGKQ